MCSCLLKVKLLRAIEIYYIYCISYTIRNTHLSRYSSLQNRISIYLGYILISFQKKNYIYYTLKTNMYIKKTNMYTNVLYKLGNIFLFNISSCPLFSKTFTSLSSLYSGCSCVIRFIEHQRSSSLSSAVKI